MNRRWFLGRAGLGIAAAPIAAQQVKDTLVNVAPSPTLPPSSTYTSRGDPEPMPAAAKAIQKQIDAWYDHRRNTIRMTKRELRAMKSWSPAFREIYRREQEQQAKTMTDRLYAQLHEILGTKQ